MAKNTEGLLKHSKNKIEITSQKVKDTINELLADRQRINFNSVSKASGVSKSFLYDNKDIKHEIEKLRQGQVNTNINQRAKFDKTSRSKDVIIASKDRKIVKLEEENIKLRLQIEFLQTRLYEKN